MGVDAQGEAGVGVAEVLGDGLDGLAGVDEHGGVEVAEGVHAVAHPFVDARLLQCRAPETRGSTASAIVCLVA